VNITTLSVKIVFTFMEYMGQGREAREEDVQTNAIHKAWAQLIAWNLPFVAINEGDLCVVGSHCGKEAWRLVRSQIFGSVLVAVHRPVLVT